MVDVGVDAEGQLILLAFALTKGETNDSWAWFLNIIRVAFASPSHDLCIISDCHPRIMNAIKLNAPGSSVVHHC